LLVSFSSIPALDRKKSFAISDHLLIISALAVLHQAAVIGCAVVESWQSSTNHQKISKKEEETNSLWQARASKRK